jgi:hypothetical protein
VLSPTEQLPRDELLDIVYQAIGVKPAAGEGPGWGWWLSESGISMEPNTNVNGGYSAGYGDEEWALGTLAMLTGDPQVLAMANKHVTNFAKFRYIDNTRSENFTSGVVSNSRTCRLETVITWRHNKNPGSISYGGGDYDSYMAVHAKNPISIRLAQLKIEHGSVFACRLVPDGVTHPASTTHDPSDSPHWPEALAKASIELTTWRALVALPPTTARLPMELGTDFVFADTQAAAVVVKHGTVVLRTSLQWRHGYDDLHLTRIPSNVKLNNVARIHVTDLDLQNSVDRILNVAMQEQHGENAGWARLYCVADVGGFTIVMNLHSSALMWQPPLQLVGRTMKELTSGKELKVSRNLKLAPQTTIVLYAATNLISHLVSDATLKSDDTIGTRPWQSQQAQPLFLRRPTTTSAGPDLWVPDLAGADPTGHNDSTAALQGALDMAFAAHRGDHAGDTPGRGAGRPRSVLRIDLGGGLYSVSRSLHLAGWAPGRIVIAGGTLLASPDFPPGEFLINLTDVSGISFEELTFDSAHRGGGLRLDCTKQISVSSVYFSCTMRPPACSATRTRRHTTPRAIGAWVTSCC